MTESQGSKYLTHNTANRKIRVLTQILVVTRTLSSPPGSPADGACYIPKATASGGWATYDNKLVFYSTSSWVSLTPAEGWVAYLQDENIFVKYDGSSWVNMGGGINATYLNGLDEENFVLRDSDDNVFIGSQSSASPSAVESSNTIHIEVGNPPAPISDHTQLYADEVSSSEGVALHVQNENGEILKMFQGASIADATDATSVINRLNDLLAHMRSMGLIAT